MADCAEGEFNRVAGADALPVLFGENCKMPPSSSRSFFKQSVVLGYFASKVTINRSNARPCLGRGQVQYPSVQPEEHLQL